MTRSRSVALLALVLALPLLAAAGAPPSPSDFPGGHYVLDPRHASLIARVKHMGVSLYTVRFNTLAASFDYDPAHPESTRLQASVDPTSLDVNADYGKQFAEEFLTVSKFPKATFTATQMQTAWASPSRSPSTSASSARATRCCRFRLAAAPPVSRPPPRSSAPISVRPT